MPRTLKRHDTADPITATVYETDPTTGKQVRADLTGFETLIFQMKTSGASEVIEGEAINIEAVDGPGGTAADGLPVNRGRIMYEQVDEDVSTIGTYKVELECVTAGGKKVHFPSTEKANDTVTVDPDHDNK